MSLIKIDSSGKYELSLKDLKNIGYLILTYCAGYYFANTDLVNSFIANHVDAQYVALATALVGYIFKQFKSDNSTASTETTENTSE